MCLKMQIALSLLFFCFLGCNGQFYEDKRCRCVCPSPSVVFNNSLSNTRKLFIANVSPNKCNCEDVIVQHLSEDIKLRSEEYCPRCECKYETRNTTVILVVVVIVLWILMLLFVYMSFLICLDPLIRRKRVRLHREEEGFAGEEYATDLDIMADLADRINDININSDVDSAAAASAMEWQIEVMVMQVNRLLIHGEDDD